MRRRAAIGDRLAILEADGSYGHFATLRDADELAAAKARVERDPITWRILPNDGVERED